MPRYLLDTNTCSYIMKGNVPAVRQHLAHVPIAQGIHLERNPKLNCATASRAVLKPPTCSRLWTNFCFG
jgi:hypothetical protein